MGFPSVHLDPFTAEIKTQTDAVGIAEPGGFYYQSGSLFMFVKNGDATAATKGKGAYILAAGGVGMAQHTPAGDAIGLWCRDVPAEEWGFVLVEGPGIEGELPWVPMAGVSAADPLMVDASGDVIPAAGAGTAKIGRAWEATSATVTDLASAYFNFMPHGTLTA